MIDKNMLTRCLKRICRSLYYIEKGHICEGIKIAPVDGNLNKCSKCLRLYDKGIEEHICKKKLTDASIANDIDAALLGSKFLTPKQTLKYLNITISHFNLMIKHKILIPQIRPGSKHRVFFIKDLEKIIEERPRYKT